MTTQSKVDFYDYLNFLKEQDIYKRDLDFINYKVKNEKNKDIKRLKQSALRLLLKDKETLTIANYESEVLSEKLQGIHYGEMSNEDFDTICFNPDDYRGKEWY